jgi:hypothetical protein
MKIKKKRGPRKNGKPWPNNIGKWAASLSAEEKEQHHQRAGPEKQEPKKADDGPWTWPIDLSRYDRSGSLTAIEQDRLPLCAEASANQYMSGFLTDCA